MARHLQREIDRLKKNILALSAMVEEAVQKAVTSLNRRDANLARDVISSDHHIDLMEVEVEEECLKVLALHQPVATDLRFIVTSLKMNDELERIGDLAANIAGRNIELCALAPVDCPFDLRGMTERVQWMLGRSIDALVNLDSDLGREVWFKDSEVDAIHKAMYQTVTARLREPGAEVEALVQWMGVCRFLERIADHATSIAKDVLYMADGEIVRHRGREFREKSQAAEG
ncbi:MAG: phosphate signaling complex protein PhoU [Fimbriimonadaceae bacterium]|nr:phosphate signaling complex protein PhoU [Fimbriimonadaceae bacterium]